MPLNPETTRLGIITYDHCHLKTEQVVHNLLRRGFRRMTLLALPFQQRPERSVLLNHRPNQADAITTADLAGGNGLEFIRYDGKSPLKDCDIYLITGAGILPPEVVSNKRILNAHPGIIPSARGLDSFKWSILEGIPVGVTLHTIDEHVDSGEVLCIVKTPVYASDSLMTLARRQYELEIDILSNFDRYMSMEDRESFPEREAHRRMPKNLEAEMIQEFDKYKEKFANSR